MSEKIYTVDDILAMALQLSTMDKVRLVRHLSEHMKNELAQGGSIEALQEELQANARPDAHETLTAPAETASNLWDEHAH